MKGRIHGAMLGMVVLLLLGGGIPAQAQFGVAFQGTSQVQSVGPSTPSGNPIAVGEIVLVASNSGDVRAGSTITVLFPLPILSTGTVRCIGGSLFPCDSDIAVSSVGPRLVITFNAGVAFQWTIPSIIISGVQLNNFGTGTAKVINAFLSSTSPDPVMDPITFNPAIVPVALSCATCASTSVNAAELPAVP